VHEAPISVLLGSIPAAASVLMVNTVIVMTAVARNHTRYALSLIAILSFRLITERYAERIYSRECQCEEVRRLSDRGGRVRSTWIGGWRLPC